MQCYVANIVRDFGTASLYSLGRVEGVVRKQDRRGVEPATVAIADARGCASVKLRILAIRLSIIRCMFVGQASSEAADEDPELRQGGDNVASSELRAIVEEPGDQRAEDRPNILKDAYLHESLVQLPARCRTAKVTPST